MTRSELMRWRARAVKPLQILIELTEDESLARACRELVAEAKWDPSPRPEDEVMPIRDRRVGTLPHPRPKWRPKTSSGTCERCSRRLRPMADRGEALCPTCRGAGIAWIEPRDDARSIG